MVAQRLLITGSAGYIGGTVLAQLLKSTFSNVQALSVSALVRHQDQADLLAQKGVIPILFESLDETDVLRKLASEHDAVIHVVDGLHHGSAEAFIQGLSERKKTTGKAGIYIHTSGASNVAEFPISKQYRGTHVFSDKEDILSYEKSRDIEEPYINRTIDLMVAERGKGLGVETYSISPPLVFVGGLTYFKTLSGGQLPMLMRSALANGHAQYVGEGAGRWSHVHVQDLAALYEVILAKALSGEIPSNDRRIFFAETGSSSFLQTAKAIGKAGFALGALASAEPVSTSLEKVAQEIFHGQAQWAEIVIASEALVSAELSRECGWKPIKSEKDWEATFEEEFRLVIDVVAHQG
ncbi:NAD dependent epimerase/dehydratase [Colletotrichum scovillei]|uniref:NAD dependent epimerase/dehydratase n=1 Tax=Colletotrichum scovillei TaxID=1209932 RepID=UPI0015C30486|nr:NAD dependent epimerase/dehydratase [Colletotrichum scovillei]KAF4775420.1 NAD dependent epimerase/dehydratase [Colletotrichum scovillei]